MTGIHPVDGGAGSCKERVKKEWWKLEQSYLMGKFYLTTYPNQILYYISLFSNIRCNMTYLLTKKYDVICTKVVLRIGFVADSWVIKVKSKETATKRHFINQIKFHQLTHTNHHVYSVKKFTTGINGRLCSRYH